VRQRLAEQSGEHIRDVWNKRETYQNIICVAGVTVRKWCQDGQGDAVGEYGT